MFVFGSMLLFFEKRSGEKNLVKVIKINDISIEVEVAGTPETRAKGLSDRKMLPKGTGMLFIFDAPAQYGFWMKDMNFAIDIIWISESSQVIGITEELAPETFPEIFYPPGRVMYVLELSAGASRNFGIDIGQVVFLDIQSTQSE